MDFIVLLSIGALCAYVAGKILSSDERNKIFNKYSIQVKDVKKYNHFCAALVIGFGVAAEITMFLANITTGLVRFGLTLLLVVEAVIVMKIYNKGEKKMLKKR